MTEQSLKSTQDHLENIQVAMSLAVTFAAPSDLNFNDKENPLNSFPIDNVANAEIKCKYVVRKNKRRHYSSRI